MKDILNNKTLPRGTIYKDVVIIGNGPSGISLSYYFSGHWPYWIPEKTDKHPDELLRARLRHADGTKSLVEQDLFELADGIEGRSTNPVSLLLDSLQNPNADLGMQMPSMLEYKYHPEKEIDHIVIGRGPAGGSWHRMDPNLRTLSLAAWMSLPGSDFNEWDRRHSTEKQLQQDQNIENRCEKCAVLRENPSDDDFVMSNNNESETGALCCKCSTQQQLINKVPRRNLSLKRQISKEVETRALISRVAEYYESYVDEMGLKKYFLNDAIVTSVYPIKMCRENFDGKYKDAKWIVSGFNRLTNKSFSYVCQHLVLANGASDLANRLGVRGEGLSIPWLKYELPHLEYALQKLRPIERLKLKPVMIVGAGLSAADAVSMCRSSGIPVIHVFRSRTVGLDKQLPENVYPEYHEVHKMMKDPSKKYDLYTPLSEHTIADLYPIPTSSGSHKVTVQHLKTHETHEIEVSFCAILIGSRPDLRFLGGIECDTTQCDEIISLSPQNTDSPLIPQDLDIATLVSKKLLWLKSLCAKCRHISKCDKTSNKKAVGMKICDHDERIQCAKLEKKTLVRNSEDDGGKKKHYRTFGLGEDPTKPVDCKNNPIAVNKYTYQVSKYGNSNLYALGPLAGDNFVRFIPGGALAITAALHKQKNQKR
ncbi:oxidative stress-induced growth inhibitor 1-like [Culicoides brevitarsis]|uniref:oxidative stress-induced growth inhibitor 1-like n=1 Tax=Culicoides brevitarsis TaxID=469753 RepID=UPI00307B38A4